jgi:hypothetical protein
MMAVCHKHERRDILSTFFPKDARSPIVIPRCRPDKFTYVSGITYSRLTWRLSRFMTAYKILFGEKKSRGKAESVISVIKNQVPKTTNGITQSWTWDQNNWVPAQLSPSSKQVPLDKSIVLLNVGSFL